MIPGFDYLYIFLQSSLLETPFYYIFHRSKLKVTDSLLLTTTANSITHPIVFFIIMSLNLTYIQNILIAEMFAIVMETLIHKIVCGISLKDSLLAAIIANLVSWQLAPLLTYWIFF